MDNKRPFETEIDGIVVTGTVTKVPGFFREYAVDIFFDGHHFGGFNIYMLTLGSPPKFYVPSLPGVSAATSVRCLPEDECFAKGLQACVAYYKENQHVE